MESNDRYLKISVKNYICYYIDVIVIFEDFYSDNILKDEKSHKHVLVYNIWWVLTLFILGSIKWMDLQEFMLELYI